jgi:hypothetical protein
MLKNSYSQAYQESFVMSMLEYKKNGFYVEVGGYDAKSLSNTYVLETEYNWRGFALEIDEKKANKYSSERKNPCIATDAITFNYEKAFKDFDAPKQIDYLQLDIEPAPNTLACLYKIPMNYRYSVITFEHDLYVDPSKNIKIKHQAQKYLESHGYKIVVSGVYASKEDPSPFEDWFVDPRVVDESIYENFISSYVRPEKLFG